MMLFPSQSGSSIPVRLECPLSGHKCIVVRRWFGMVRILKSPFCFSIPHSSISVSFKTIKWQWQTTFQHSFKLSILLDDLEYFLEFFLIRFWPICGALSLRLHFQNNTKNQKFLKSAHLSCSEANFSLPRLKFVMTLAHLSFFFVP